LLAISYIKDANLLTKHPSVFQSPLHSRVALGVQEALTTCSRYVSKNKQYYTGEIFWKIYYLKAFLSQYLLSISHKPLAALPRCEGRRHHVLHGCCQGLLAALREHAKWHRAGRILIRHRQEGTHFWGSARL